MPGKKAGQLEIHVARSEMARLELRVDTKSGEWICVVDQLMYVSTDKAELERHVRDLLRSKRSITWTRYIVIDYEAEGPGGFSQRRRYDAGTRPLHARHEIAGIRLDWEIMDYSDPIQHPGQSNPRRKYRDVYESSVDSDPNVPSDDDSYGLESWAREDKIPSGAIVYTPQRYALLKEIRRAMGELDAKLATLFAGGQSQVAAAMDRISLASGMAGLLAAPNQGEGDDDE